MGYQDELLNRHLEGKSIMSKVYSEEKEESVEECSCDDYNGYICNECKKEQSLLASEQWVKLKSKVKEESVEKIVKKNYLAYMEVLEGSAWQYGEDLEFLKGLFFFTQRIFEVPNNFDYESFKKLNKPRFQEVQKKYKQVYSHGNLLHEKNTKVKHKNP